MNRPLVALTVAGCLAGCAYYNGLYNANRLAREARRAERDGRTGEARSLWSQAAVKAESVVARHPRSTWRDDALLLQGVALERLGTCPHAVRPLAIAADSSPERDIRTQARLLLGSCRLQMVEPEAALAALAPVLDEGTAGERGRARLLRGEALLRLGRDTAALEELAASGAPEAAFPRAVALAHLERVPEAVAALETAVPAPFDEATWLAVLDTVGGASPAAVAGLVDALTSRSDAGLGARLRLWLDDGERWLAAADTTRAEERLGQVRAAGPDSAAGRSARAYLGLIALARAGEWTEVDPLLDSLDVAVRPGGDAVQIAGRHSRVLSRARDGLGPDGSGLGLFMAAEAVRDSLLNPALAASLFAEVHARFPDTPLGPKALLALVLLRPQSTDSLITVLREQYPASPYTLALLGAGDDAYRALEDSLRRAMTEGPRPQRGNQPRRTTEEAPRRVRNER